MSTPDGVLVLLLALLAVALAGALVRSRARRRVESANRGSFARARYRLAYRLRYGRLGWDRWLGTDTRWRWTLRLRFEQSAYWAQQFMNDHARRVREWSMLDPLHPEWQPLWSPPKRGDGRRAFFARIKRRLFDRWYEFGPGRYEGEGSVLITRYLDKASMDGSGDTLSGDDDVRGVLVYFDWVPWDDQHWVLHISSTGFRSAFPIDDPDDFRAQVDSDNMGDDDPDEFVVEDARYWMDGDEQADEDDHTHVWGPVEEARFTGNPHRKCTVPGCTFISLDIWDDDNDPSEIEGVGGVSPRCDYCGRAQQPEDEWDGELGVHPVCAYEWSLGNNGAQEGFPINFAGIQSPVAYEAGWRAWHAEHPTIDPAFQRQMDELLPPATNDQGAAYEDDFERDMQARYEDQA